MFEAGCDTQDQYKFATSASCDVATTTSINQPISSLGTVTSTSNTSINTQLQEKVNRLEKENRNLQGRIRGYTTLGSLLQEEKEKNQKLLREYEEMKRFKAQLVNTPQDTDETRVESLKHSSFHGDMQARASLTTSSHIEDDDHTEHDKNHLEHPHTDQVCDPPPSSISSEVIPLQESMHDQLNDLSELAANPSMSVSNPPNTHEQNINITENLQLDSDRFEDPEYEKVGRPSSTFAQTSNASLTSSSSQKFNFPSLISGTSMSNRNGTERHVDVNDLNLMLSCSEPPTSLGHQVGRVANMLSSEQTSATVSKPAIAIKLRQLSDDVEKKEHELIKHKKLNKTLCEDLQRLKISKQIELHEEKSKSYQLRVVNQTLEARVRELEAQHGRTSDSLTRQGWVDVDKHLGSKCDMELFENSPAQLPTDVNGLNQMVQDLNLKNKQLKDANNSWRQRWNQLELNKDSMIKSLGKQLADKNLELNKAYASDNEKQREFEQMLCAAKAHAADEENAKEEALQQLHFANIAQTELKKKIASLERDNAELVRVKHAVEAEVSVLKKQCYKPQDGSRPGETLDSLKTEIAVLRQQLTVFEEDFERERQDRASTQSARDELQKKYEAVYRSKRNYSDRFVNQQKKCEHLEMELNQARRQIQTLENENRRIKAELKKQAAMQVQPLVRQPLPYPPPYPHYHNPYGQQGYFQPTQVMPPPMQGYARSQVPLEHLPGTWTCGDCTFVNIAERTVCDMCGTITQRPHGQRPHAVTPGSNPEVALMSRGRDVPDNDIVTDDDLAVDDGLFK